MHNKEDFPDVAKRGFVVGPGLENYVALDSTSIYYTPSIPKIPFKNRKCYVEDELYPLDYHGKYTRSACLFECRTKHIVNICNCLPYYISGTRTGRGASRNVNK